MAFEEDFEGEVMLTSLSFRNGLFAFFKDKPFTVTTVKDVQDEDWKTAIAHNLKPIPAGTELQVTYYLNFYGEYFKAEYNGHIYYIRPRDCNFKNQ